jgi:citrate lyase beta subunit
MAMSDRLADIRSLLITPAWDGAAVKAALTSAADAVVLDLEDLTPLEHKESARQGLPEHVSTPRVKGAIAVRINSVSAELRADLAVVTRLPVDFLLVPKATRKSVADLSLLRTPLVAVIETAQGLREAYEIGSTPDVHAIALGANDLASDLGLGGPLANGLLSYARAKVVFDAAAARLRPPFDRVTPVHDPAAVRADALKSCALGFGGKSCIRPDDAMLINRVFAEGATRAAAVTGR